MDGLNFNSITAAGNAAATTVASALVPKRHSTTGVGQQTAAPGATAHATAASGSTSSSSSSSTAVTTQNITSTDFLTLLVSELKNQDPTQPTDPNQYITQLAQVNSLQQLIQINSGISTLDGALTPASSTVTPTA